MSWPNCTDYQEVVQNPKTCFDDYELRYGLPTLNHLGLPRAISGNFASVFQFDCAGHKHAVRCFNRYQIDQQNRYAAISSYLNERKLPCMVDFNFVPRGIRIRGQWYPILKMDWIEGETLNSFIERNLGHPEILDGLSTRFLELISTLKANSIAHGDLQHGNILISNNEIRLIDYDGMYVPILEEKTSNEIGHPNYQHPFRTEQDFGPYLDNFSAWIIFLSIKIVSLSPSIWNEINGGDEKLVLCRKDFENPTESKLLNTLDSSNNPRLLEISDRIKSICYCSSLADVCSLDGKAVSDLGRDKSAFATTIGTLSPAGASWVWDHIPISYRQIRSSALPEKIALSCVILINGILAFVLPSMGSSRAIIGPLLPVVSTLLLAGIVYFRYTSITEVREKRKLLQDQKRLAKEIIENSSGIEELIRAKTGQEYELKNRENQTRSDMNGLTQNEYRELMLINNELQKNIAYIKSPLSNLIRDENGDIQQALRTLQASFLNQKLALYHIAQSTISGIGSELKKRLIAGGIRTAADILNVRVVSSGYGRYFHDVVYLEVTGRGSVHIEGIGSIKANEILDWKKAIESRYRGQMPHSIPQDHLKRIKMKYDAQRKTISEKERIARLEAEQKIELVKHKHRLEKETLTNKMSAIRKQHLDKISLINKQIEKRNMALSEINFEFGKKQYEIKNFRHINIGNYLKRIIH